MAYYELEPFGATRDNMHSAQIVSLLYNVNKRKGAPPKESSDFLFKDEYTRRQDDTGDFMAGLRSLAKKAH